MARNWISTGALTGINFPFNGSWVGNIDNAASFSVALWFQFVNSGASHTFAQKVDTFEGTTTKGLFYVGGGTAILEFFSMHWTTGNGHWTCPAPATNATTWHSLVVTYSGSATTNNPVMYLDGVSQTVTKVAAPTGTYTFPDHAPIWIGNDNTGNFGAANSLAHVCMWNDILAQKHATSFHRGAAPPFIMPERLHFWAPIRGLGVGAEPEYIKGLTANKYSSAEIPTQVKWVVDPPVTRNWHTFRLPSTKAIWYSKPPIVYTIDVFSAEFGVEAGSPGMSRIGVKPTGTQVLDATSSFATSMSDFLLFYENSGVPNNLAAPTVTTTTTLSPTWETVNGVIAGLSTAGATYNVPNHGNITAGDFSLRLIFNLKSYVAFQTLFSKATGSTPGRELSLFLDTSGNPDYMDVGGVFIDASTIPTGFLLNLPYDLVITRSGTTLKFYVNGAQVGGSLTSSGTTGIVAALRLSSDAFGGANSNADIFLWETWIGRVLSSTEIATLYAAPYTGAINLTIGVISAEFGAEVTSVGLVPGLHTQSAEFGWEGTSVAVSENVPAVPAEFGWEGTSAAVVTVLSVQSAEFGAEATSVGLVPGLHTQSPEFGWEGTSVAVSENVPAVPAEFGWEGTSAAVSENVPAVPAEFGWEGTSVALATVLNTQSAEFGWEGKSVALVPGLNTQSAEFGWEGTSVALTGNTVSIIAVPAEFGWEGPSPTLFAGINTSIAAVSAEFEWEGKSVALVPGLHTQSAEFGYEVRSVKLPSLVYSWNPSDYDSDNLVLSNSNLTMTATNLGSRAVANGGNWYSGARSTQSHTTGKWYFEITMVANTGNGGIGIGTIDASISGANIGDGSGVGGTGADKSIGYYIGSGIVQKNSVNLGIGPIGSQGDVVGVAVDLTNSRIWYRVNSGKFIKDGSTIDDLSVATDWFSFSSLSGNAMFAMANTLSAGDYQIANFGDTAFVAPIPYGFTSWDGSQVGLDKNAFGYQIQSVHVQIYLYNLVVTGARFGFEIFGRMVDAVTITANNQIVDGLTIFATGSSNGITCNVFSGVIIRNCVIYHGDGHGIKFANADNITIQNCSIIKYNSPAFGVNLTSSNNIDGLDSVNPMIGGATADLGNRVENGSAGVYIQTCPSPHVLFLEGHNMRGPFPRGQLVQFNQSPDGEIRHFSVVNDLAISFTEDNINLFASPRTAVSDGVLDGNNSPSGDGVIAESGSDDCTIDSVDVLNWGNGAFASVGSNNAVFTNCRADLWHSDGGRGPASSNGLTFASFSGATNTSFDSTNIFGVNSSTNILFDIASMTIHQPTGPLAFVARSPLNLNVPQGGDPVPLSVGSSFPANSFEYGFEASGPQIQLFSGTIPPFALQSIAPRIVYVASTRDRGAFAAAYASLRHFFNPPLDRVFQIAPTSRTVLIAGTPTTVLHTPAPSVPQTSFRVEVDTPDFGYETNGVGPLGQNTPATSNEFGFQVGSPALFNVAHISTLDVRSAEFGHDVGALTISPNAFNIIPAEFGYEAKSATLTQKHNVIVVHSEIGYETFGIQIISQSGGSGPGNPNILSTTILTNATVWGPSGVVIARDPTNTSDGRWRFDDTEGTGLTWLFNGMTLTPGIQYTFSGQVTGTVPFDVYTYDGGAFPGGGTLTAHFTPNGTVNQPFSFTFIKQPSATGAGAGSPSIGLVYGYPVAVVDANTHPARLVSDSVGINTHIDFPGSNYTNNLTNTIAAINFLGVKHIRDCPNNDTDLTGTKAWSLVASGTGGKFLSFIGETNVTNATTQANRMTTLAGQGILWGLDGPNEWDSQFAINAGGSLDQGSAFLKNTMFPLSQSLGLPLANMTFGAGWTAANNFIGDYATQGDLSAWCTYANPHTYPNVGASTFGSISRLNDLAHMAAASRPILCTEIGWDNKVHTTSDSALFALQAVFSNILLGVLRQYFYALFDDVGGGLFGMMNPDGVTPHPSGLAIHNLMALLADPGALANRQDTLTYTTTGTTANDRFVTVEKSTGVFLVAVWNESDAQHNVTFNFGSVKTTLKTYRPLTTTAAQSSVSNAQTVTVSVGAEVRLVEITP